MNLFDQLTARAPNRVFIAIVLGALSGIAYSLLIPIMLSAIKESDGRLQLVEALPVEFLGVEVAQPPFAAVFAAVAGFILVARTLSQVALTRLAVDAASDLRARMYDRILRAPLPALERIGMPRITAVLMTDIPRIVIGARVIPDLLSKAVMLVGMLSFLLFLNVDVFLFVLGCIAFGIVTYQIPMFFGRRSIVRARHEFDGLHEAIEGLTGGVKELKLNDSKRQAFLEDVLMRHERDVSSSEKTGQTIVRAAANYGDLICFFAIGSILFIFVNYRPVSTTEMIGVIMALLYITGPIALILGNIPHLSNSRVSLQRYSSLFEEMGEEVLGVSVPAVRAWETLRFEGVEYRHAAADGRNFQVGPIDLDIRKGQIAFIVGGNGSGKSTLGKLLTLHYRAAAGRIFFGEQEVDDDSLGALRQGICAIYSDYHLFDRVHGLTDGEDLTAQVRHYLRALKLEGKTEFRDGRFSTLALSDGERRRVALLVAMLEDRELYLFDEWAADQDPEFKAVFYGAILPALKKRNKAVVVISHDDRYFGVADKIIRLEDGKLAVAGAEPKRAAGALPEPHAPASVELPETIGWKS